MPPHPISSYWTWVSSIHGERECLSAHIITFNICLAVWLTGSEVVSLQRWPTALLSVCLGCGFRSTLARGVNIDCLPCWHGRKPHEYSEPLAWVSIAWPWISLRLKSSFRTCISSVSLSRREEMGRVHRATQARQDAESLQRSQSLSGSTEMPTPGISTPFPTVLAVERLPLWLLTHHPPLEGLSLTALCQASTEMCALFCNIYYAEIY